MGHRQLTEMSLDEKVGISIKRDMNLFFTVYSGGDNGGNETRWKSGIGMDIVN